MLDEIAKRKTIAERRGSIHVDRRDREQTRLGRDSFDSQKRETRFVERIGAEGVSFVHLKRLGYVVACGVERGSHIWTTRVETGLKVISINAIRRKVLIDPNVVLQSITVVG